MPAGESGEAYRLLSYSEDRPLLHLVDTVTSADTPMPSPADDVDAAVDRVLLRDGYFAYRQSGVGVVTLPRTFEGEWVQIGEEWGPVPSRDPSLMWVHTDANARLVDQFGRVQRSVDASVGRMVHAEFDGRLFTQADDGSVFVLRIDDGRVVDTWGKAAVLGASTDGVIGWRHGDGRGLRLLDLSGDTLARCELPEGWRWSSSGELSPDGRYLVDHVMEDVPFKEVLKARRMGRTYDRKWVIADLVTERVVEVGAAPERMAYLIWDRTGRAIVFTDHESLHIVSPELPTVRPLGSAHLNACPLVDLTDSLVRDAPAPPPHLTQPTADGPGTVPKG